MRTWMGTAMLAATVAAGGMLASAPAMAAHTDAPQKAAPQAKARTMQKTMTTDISAQRRHHRHIHHHHRHWRHYGYYPHVYAPRYGYGRYGYGYGYRPYYYRPSYGPAYYPRPYVYRPAYYGYGYRPYGYGPGFGFGGGPLSIGFSFGRW